MTLIILFNTIFTHNTIVKNVNIELEFNEENAFIYVKNQTNDIGLLININNALVSLFQNLKKLIPVLLILFIILLF